MSASGMSRRADAFAILPGGIGTLDEMFEIVSWKQLRLHDKPILLVDIGGYWARCARFSIHIIDTGFAACADPKDAAGGSSIAA